MSVAVGFLSLYLLSINLRNDINSLLNLVPIGALELVPLAVGALLDRSSTSSSTSFMKSIQVLVLLKLRASRTSWLSDSLTSSTDLSRSSRSSSSWYVMALVLVIVIAGGITCACGAGGATGGITGGAAGGVFPVGRLVAIAPPVVMDVPPVGMIADPVLDPGFVVTKAPELDPELKETNKAICFVI